MIKLYIKMTDADLLSSLYITTLTLTD